MRIQQFIGGLRDDLIDDVLKHRDSTYDQTKQSALLMELLLLRKKNQSFFVPFASTSAPSKGLSVAAPGTVISSMSTCEDAKDRHVSTSVVSSLVNIVDTKCYGY